MPTTTIPWAGQVPYGQQAGAINQFMTGEAIKPFIANLPGYANMVGQRSQNTQQMLKGELPQDVIQQIGQQAAERGIGGGQSGGPNANAAFLRALGLNSLDMMGQGSKELTQSVADTPVPELWNPASLWMPGVLGAQEESAAIRGQQRGIALDARANQEATRRAAAVAWNASSGSGFNAFGRPWGL